MLSIVALGLSAGPFIGLLPIVAHNVFGGGAGITSIFVTAQGAGAILGALVVPRLGERWGREHALLIGFGSLVPGLAVYAIAPSSAVAAGALLVVGAGYFCVLVSGQAMLQLDAPVELRARVLALFSIALGLPYVVAVTVHGFVGDAWGLRETHLMMATITAVLGLLLFRRAPKDPSTEQS